MLHCKRPFKAQQGVTMWNEPVLANDSIKLFSTLLTQIALVWWTLAFRHRQGEACRVCRYLRTLHIFLYHLNILSAFTTIQGNRYKFLFRTLRSPSGSFTSFLYDATRFRCFTKKTVIMTCHEGSLAHTYTWQAFAVLVVNIMQRARVVLSLTQTETLFYF